MNPQLKKILADIPRINPRIKELAVQADCNIDLMGYGEGNLEEFARLIVRECAEFIAPLGDYCGGHGEPSAPSSRECARRLKQHFGVEE